MANMDEMLQIDLCNGQVRVMLCETTGTVQRCADIHATSPVCTAALGRLMTGTAMLGIMMKGEEENVTVTIKGDGPMGTLVAVADHGKIRACADNPQVELPLREDGKLDVGGAVGLGVMSIIHDIGMKEPYIGSVQLVSGEIAEDITAYFAQSEQIPTACALGVLVGTDQSVTAAGGYIIQLLPGAPESIIDRIEEGIAAAGYVTKLLAAGMDGRVLLETVLNGFDLEILETTPVSYRCYCSRDRVTRTLISLGREELQSIVDDGKPITIDCQFCDKLYTFTPQQVREILSSL